MHMAILKMRGSSADRLIPSLVERGFLLDIVDEDNRSTGGTEYSAFSPVRDEALPEFQRVIEEFGGTIASMANPSLPPSDPAEYHVDSPVLSLEGGVSVYLVRLRRYERIR